MSFLTFVLFVVGLILLVIGANALVRGAVGLAARLGTPPLIIGLTVVAFGTSSPEVLVSLQAAFAGDPEIALGNVVGSNIFNVLFILGLSAAITPLLVSERLVRRDVPIMIAVSFLVYGLSLDGRLGRGDGLLLVMGILVYVASLVRRAKAASPAELGHIAEIDVEVKPAAHWWVDAALVAGGLALQVLGARWLVNGAVAIAVSLGVSQLVIGLTIVAAGTSLPEVATSVAASVRGQRDIAVGNVVGSNIFNLLLVLGAASLVGPEGLRIPAGALSFDLPVMTAVAVACLPIFARGYSIGRWEGAVFLGYYIAYTVFLVLDATDHASADIFGGVLMLFVVPITVLTFIVVTLRARRKNAVADPQAPS